MTKRTKRRWSYKTGEKGRNRVRVFEHGSGVLMLEYRAAGERKRASLRHRDRERAKQQADDVAARLARPEAYQVEEAQEGLTLGRLFEMYLDEVTPRKSDGAQRFDRAASRRLLRCLGKERRAETLSLREWSLFIHERSNGRITGSQVGPRTVARDLKFLMAVLNWATLCADGHGNVLLERNPLKGLPLPKENNPRRPMISDHEYRSMVEAADEVHPSLKGLLIITHETGHRVAAVRQLRWSDIDIEQGTALWRAETDKTEREHITPLSGQAVAALREQEQRSEWGAHGYVFPSPATPLKPISRHFARDLWRRGEAAAGLPRITGRGWHCLRRKFATEMSDVPLKFLCDLGGWRDPDTVVRCYQRPDEEALRAALSRRKTA
jgi:integrase